MKPYKNLFLAPQKFIHSFIHSCCIAVHMNCVTFKVGVHLPIM